MSKYKKWKVDGVIVTSTDVQRWMMTVGRRCADRTVDDYIRLWNVRGKIAAAKRRGDFEQILAIEAAQAGIKLRKLPGPRRNPSQNTHLGI